MRVVLAVLVSIAAHALLVAALAWCLSGCPAPDSDATLGVAHVEISFAEAEDASAAPSRLPSAAEAAPPPVLPDALPSPTVADELAFATPKLPPVELTRSRPAPARPAMETPSAPSETSAPSAPSAPSETSAQSAPSAPRQAEVDAPPSLRRPIRPDYPHGARRRGEEGDVVLEIEVTTGGSVGEVRVVESSGWNDLDAAAVKAAKIASFSPARSGDRTVAQKVRLRLSFKLK